MATTEQQKESDGLQDIRESSDTVPRSFRGKFNTLGTLSSQHGNTGGKFRGKNLWKDSPKRCPVNLWIVLISKMTTDQVSILNVVSNLELRWFCFTIGWEKSRHPLNQSDSKRKPTAFGHLQFPAHFYCEFSLACCDSFLSCDWPSWLLWFLWHSSGRRSNWLHLDSLSCCSDGMAKRAITADRGWVREALY